MAQIDSNTRETNLRFVDDDTGLQVNINNSILSMSVSYSADLASQISVTVHDPGLTFAKNNFFHVTRTVFFSPETLRNYQDPGIAVKTPEITLDSISEYRIQVFEIAAAEITQGPGSSAVWNIELRPKTVQQMKRDINARSYKGKGSEYVRAVCEKYNMLPLIEYTGKMVSISGANNSKAADSVWDVLSSLASEAKFVVYESDNTLVFASQRYLLGIYGSEHSDVEIIDPVTNAPVTKRLNYIPVRWPARPSDLLRLISIPTVRRSDNDPLEVRGSMVVNRLSATTLRPGMTIRILGLPYMDGLYLIDSVEYDYLGNQPVTVSFRSPEREKKDIRQFDIGKIYPALYNRSVDGTDFSSGVIEA